MESSILRTQEIGIYNNSTHQIDGSYDSYDGSPLSKGKMQFDLWESTPVTNLNWSGLRLNLSTYGCRNSLLVAPMPTASTSQILGNNECIEPFTSNLYTRRVLAGDFMVVNKYLVDDLTKLGLWTSEIRTEIIANNGSIQSIKEIPEDLREVYKTVWEIKQKAIIDHSVIRGYFTDQSQSQNLFFPEPDTKKLSSALIYGWKQGLKTLYYCRSEKIGKADKVSKRIEREIIKELNMTALIDGDTCLACEG
jgi:ribonucleoside-diphosphate reductase alpha chain